MWFEYKLIPYDIETDNHKKAHFIPISKDLKDLIPIIKWCINNDDKCKIIANNGVKFYKTYLKRDGVLDYYQTVLTRLAQKSA